MFLGSSIIYVSRSRNTEASSASSSTSRSQTARARSTSRCAKPSRTSFSNSVATSFMCLRPTIARGTRAARPILTERLAMFLARSPTRSRSPATRIAPMISRKSSATGCLRALDLALQGVELGVRCNHLRRERSVGIRERVHGVDDHFFGNPTHLDDAPSERVEFLAVGFDGVVDHESPFRPYFQVLID